MNAEILLEITIALLEEDLILESPRRQLSWMPVRIYIADDIVRELLLPQEFPPTNIEELSEEQQARIIKQFVLKMAKSRDARVDGLRFHRMRRGVRGWNFDVEIGLDPTEAKDLDKLVESFLHFPPFSAVQEIPIPALDQIQ
jgi:hypothetical protein